jgi:hypothetical protein
VIDESANVNGQAEAEEETPGVDDETPGVDNAEEIPGVDNAEEIPGVDDETSGVDDGHENEVEPDKIEDNIIERASVRMNEDTHDNGIILLQFNSDNFEITEEKFDETDAEYMFLTKTLEWKEGLSKERDQTLDANTNDVTKLDEYLFLAEHMG